jgi:hypothetical protein
MFPSFADRRPTVQRVIELRNRFVTNLRPVQAIHGGIKTFAVAVKNGTCVLKYQWEFKEKIKKVMRNNLA